MKPSICFQSLLYIYMYNTTWIKIDYFVFYVPCQDLTTVIFSRFIDLIGGMGEDNIHLLSEVPSLLPTLYLPLLMDHLLYILIKIVLK